jgi:predicted phage baseplate assembly protein
VQPVLLEPTPAAVTAAVMARVADFTPTWTALTPDDAGVALVRLFGALMEPVLTRLNRLPEKAFVEALRLLGIAPLAAEPAAAVLQFTVLNSATDPVLVPKGFQVGARLSAGGGMTILETQDDLYATVAQIAQALVQERSFFLDVTQAPGAASPIRPFGDTATTGTALYLGLKNAQPQVRISLGVTIDTPAGTPAPAAAGGLTPLPIGPTPTLVWEAYDGGSGAFQSAAVISDDTGGLVQSGIVVLALPAVWAPGTPPGVDAQGGLYWLRLRIAQGQFAPAPVLSGLPLLNVVRALAVQTVTDEPVDFGSDTTLRHATLSRAPVLRDSLVVAVLDNPLSATDRTLWQEAADLELAGPDQQVYEFDPATGEITFGDGVHGAAVPPGFRNVLATYQAISPSSSGVLAAGAATTLINSVPLVTAVTNPNPGSGGTVVGSQAEAIRRGPQDFRARGRAVTTADFALLAAQAGGIVKAHAIAGRHPAYPGTPIPGVVGVYVVPPDTNPTPGQGAPPVPTAATLSAVADFLSANAALAGVDVVVAAPTYRYVRAEVAVVVDPSRAAAEAYRDVQAALTDYLHPVTGGADGAGWPFGAPLLYTPLVLFLVARVRGIAIQSLTLVIDGQRLAPCADFPIGEDSLFWSLQHQIVPGDEEGES